MRINERKFLKSTKETKNKKPQQRIIKFLTRKIHQDE